MGWNHQLDPPCSKGAFHYSCKWDISPHPTFITPVVMGHRKIIHVSNTYSRPEESLEKLCAFFRPGEKVLQRSLCEWGRGISRVGFWQTFCFFNLWTRHNPAAMEIVFFMLSTGNRVFFSASLHSMTRGLSPVWQAHLGKRMDKDPPWSFYIKIHLSIIPVRSMYGLYLPGTQMTLVLVWKGLVWTGWPWKTEVIWVPRFLTFIAWNKDRIQCLECSWAWENPGSPTISL